MTCATSGSFLILPPDMFGKEDGGGYGEFPRESPSWPETSGDLLRIEVYTVLFTLETRD
jgi:hypothetical protein